jgi:hypothetical protein
MEGLTRSYRAPKRISVLALLLSLTAPAFRRLQPTCQNYERATSTYSTTLKRPHFNTDFISYTFFVPPLSSFITVHHQNTHFCIKTSAFHFELPYNGYAICPLCLNYAIKEGKEITRHLRLHHGLAHPYPPIFFAPQVVARALLDGNRVLTGATRQYDGVTRNPWIQPATLAMIIGWFNARGKPLLPMILQYTSLPPARLALLMPLPWTELASAYQPFPNGLPPAAQPAPAAAIAPAPASAPVAPVIPAAVNDVANAADDDDDNNGDADNEIETETKNEDEDDDDNDEKNLDIANNDNEDSDDIDESDEFDEPESIGG